jgi:Protein of unknown function (DUF3300)
MTRILAAVALALLIASTGVAPAQTNPSAPGVAPAQTNAVPRAPDQSQQVLSAGQLDALVAPIALYPDTLIAEILMASTYPLEVVEAQRWEAAHKGLTVQSRGRHPELGRQRRIAGGDALGAPNDER